MRRAQLAEVVQKRCALDTLNHDPGSRISRNPVVDSAPNLRGRPIFHPCSSEWLGVDPLTKKFKFHDDHDVLNTAFPDRLLADRLRPTFRATQRLAAVAHWPCDTIQPAPSTHVVDRSLSEIAV